MLDWPKVATLRGRNIYFQHFYILQKMLLAYPLVQHRTDNGINNMDIITLKIGILAIAGIWTKMYLNRLGRYFLVCPVEGRTRNDNLGALAILLICSANIGMIVALCYTYPPELMTEEVRVLLQAFCQPLQTLINLSILYFTS